MKSLSYLNKYFYKYRLRLLLGILFIIVQNYFGAKMPVIVGQTTDQLLQSKGSISTSEAIFWSALGLAGMYLLFSIIKGFFLFLTRQTIIVMSRYIELDLKNEIYNKYQQLHYTFYKGQSTGDLMNRISEDVGQVRQYLGPGIMYTVNLMVLFPFVCYQMFKINSEIALYSLIPLPIMTVLIYFVSNRMNRLSKEVQKEQSQLSTIAQETFSGMRVIKAYIQEKHTQEKFKTSSHNYHTKNMRLVRTNALFMPTISVLIGASTLLSIYIGGLYTIEHRITPGNIITFISCVYMLTWPFASVGWVTSIIQRAGASQHRINEFLMVEPAIQNTSSDSLEKLNEIEFKNVDFQYSPTLPLVLKSINFTIKRGQTIGIIGKTGSGKSTLIQLIVRQIDSTAGEITYNSCLLKSINLNQFRSEIAVVPQDVFLFSDTIRNNILFGTKNTTDSENRVHEAAKNAHVLHNIEAFPDQFETLLGERGVNLSGGQKQRVSIARALIREPQLLILDDCLSAVDTETEEIILNNLKRFTEKHETTTVIVSHRASSLRNANHIIVLNEGQIVENGTHEELMKIEGHYFELYEKQLNEESIDQSPIKNPVSMNDEMDDDPKIEHEDDLEDL